MYQQWTQTRIYFLLKPGYCILARSFTFFWIMKSTFTFFSCWQLKAKFHANFFEDCRQVWCIVFISNMNNFFKKTIFHQRAYQMLCSVKEWSHKINLDEFKNIKCGNNFTQQWSPVTKSLFQIKISVSIQNWLLLWFIGIEYYNGKRVNTLFNLENLTIPVLFKRLVNKCYR